MLDFKKWIKSFIIKAETDLKNLFLQFRFRFDSNIVHYLRFLKTLVLLLDFLQFPFYEDSKFMITSSFDLRFDSIKLKFKGSKSVFNQFFYSGFQLCFLFVMLFHCKLFDWENLSFYYKIFIRIFRFYVNFKTRNSIL